MLREGDPVLHSVSINQDADGRPVEFGRTVFVGDHVTLIMSPDG
jgi:GntR family transcriptional regulator, phosphonate transport system regulatory protein